MASLYSIDQAIMDCIDFESGEVVDAEQLDSLQMLRTEKLENVALWIKNLTADAKAIREEEKALASRRQQTEKKVKSLNEWLTNALQGEKLSTPKVAVSFRRSEGLEVIDNDSFCLWAMGNERDDLLKFTAPTIDATAVKKAIKAGLDVPYVRIEERMNINIK